MNRIIGNNLKKIRIYFFIYPRRGSHCTGHQSFSSSNYEREREMPIRLLEKQPIYLAASCMYSLRKIFQTTFCLHIISN